MRCVSNTWRCKFFLKTFYYYLFNGDLDCTRREYSSHVTTIPPPNSATKTTVAAGGARDACFCFDELVYLPIELIHNIQVNKYIFTKTCT